MNTTSASSATMKAAVADRYGAAGVIEIRDVPVPEPGPGQVRVRIHASSLNPIDHKLREGSLKVFLPLRFPAILGLDLAGVVDAAGPDVTEWKAGDRVYGRLDRPTGGAHAQFAVVSSAVLDRIPEKLDFEEAAGIPLAGMSALQALREAAGLKAGQRLFVVGATGGVGVFAVQIGRAMGASVTAMVSTHGLDLARRLGALGFVDYSRGEFERHGELHDVVFETSGRRSFGELARLLAPKGAFVTTGFSPEIALRILLSKVEVGPRVHAVMSRPDGALLRTLSAWVSEGKLRPVIDSTFPLECIREAYAKLETGHPLGKVIVTID